MTCHCSNFTQTIDVYDSDHCLNASRVVSYELVFSLFNYSHSTFTYRLDHGSLLYHRNYTFCEYDVEVFPLSFVCQWMVNHRKDCIPYEELQQYFDSVLTGRNISAAVSYSMVGVAA